MGSGRKAARQGRADPARRGPHARCCPCRRSGKSRRRTRRTSGGGRRRRRRRNGAREAHGMTDIPYHRIASQFYNRPLWLMPSAAETISAFLLTRMRQGRASAGGESDSGSTTQLFPATAKPDGSVEVHRSRASRFYGEYPDRRRRTAQALPARRPTARRSLPSWASCANRGAYVGALERHRHVRGLQVPAAPGRARTSAPRPS